MKEDTLNESNKQDCPGCVKESNKCNMVIDDEPYHVNDLLVSCMNAMADALH